MSTLTHCILSFLKGDMFIVHNELDDGWMWVTNVRTEEQGLIVEDLVEEVVSKALDRKVYRMLREQSYKSLWFVHDRKTAVIDPSQLLS